LDGGDVHITLTAYSVLREKLPPGSAGKVSVEFPEGSSLADLLATYDLPLETACSINGSIERNRKTVLREGDHVAVFRPGAGG
jgi:sulfur carrier protein ThiS